MIEKLSICLLNDTFPPIIDGVANATYNYAEHLTRFGNDVSVAVPNLPGVQDNYSFDVVRYPSINIKKIAHCRTGIPLSVSALRDILSHSPEVFHTHCPFVSGLFARALRRLGGAPLILTYHTKFDIDIENTVENPLARLAVKKFIAENAEACDEVWTVSRGAGENLKSLGYEGDYRVMENGVDFRLGRADGEAIKNLRDELRLPNTPVFLFVGRMLWYKGLRIIVDGLAKAAGQGADFRMVFVGDGSDLEEVREHAKNAGISDKCVFTGAIYDRERLRVFFSLADMFLFPSTYDTNGIVVREAAACSLGSVLIRGSCAAEGVEDGKNGVMIDENAESLCGAVLQLLGNPELRRKIGDNAAQTLYISWEDAVKKANARYAELVAERRSISRVAVN